MSINSQSPTEAIERLTGQEYRGFNEKIMHPV